MAAAAAATMVTVTLSRPVHQSLLPEISHSTSDLTAGNACSGLVEALAVLLGPALSAVLIAVGGLPFALLGWVPAAWAGFGLVALCGAGKPFFDVVLRTFVQRLLPDRLLAPVFGVQESMMMAGLAVGSVAVAEGHAGQTYL